MSIESLTVRHVRIIEHAEIEPSPGVNLITGLNAAGKTSLLEAIDILSRGRSFRTHRLDRLVTAGESKLTVSARLHRPHPPVINIGLERSRAGTQIRIQGRAAESVAELAALLPVQALHPESHQLIQGGAAHRRAYIDWGTFHVEQRFLSVWRRYYRALRQRNAALRSAAPPEAVRAWHYELSETGQLVDRYRKDYLQALLPVIDQYSRMFPSATQIQLHYRRGWPEDGEHDLDAALERELLADLQRGHTRLGPHRADLEIRLNGRPASGTASRGQQKLIAAVLRLAQTQLFTARTGRACVFLIDDLPAELAPGNRQLLLQALAQLSLQVFITAIDIGDLELSMWPQAGLFHVEHGHIYRMI